MNQLKRIDAARHIGLCVHFQPSFFSSAMGWWDCALNVSTDEVATPKTSSITHCFTCLRRDHVEVGVQQPPSWFSMSLQFNTSELEMVIDCSFYWLGAIVRINQHAFTSARCGWPCPRKGRQRGSLPTLGLSLQIEQDPQVLVTGWRIWIFRVCQARWHSEMSFISFLQHFMYRGLSHADIKVYASTVYTCHKGFGDRSTREQEKVAKGTCCLTSLQSSTGAWGVGVGVGPLICFWP